MQAKERSYETMLSFGKRGLNIAATAAVQAAAKVPGGPSSPSDPHSHPQCCLGKFSSLSLSPEVQLSIPGNRGER